MPGFTGAILCSRCLYPMPFIWFLLRVCIHLSTLTICATEYYCHHLRDISFLPILIRFKTLLYINL